MSKKKKQRKQARKIAQLEQRFKVQSKELYRLKSNQLRTLKSLDDLADVVTHLKDIIKKSSNPTQQLSMGVKAVG